MLMLPLLAAMLCRQHALCSCERLGPHDALAQAAAVFEAIPVAVRDTSLPVHGRRQRATWRIYTLASARHWKGESGDTVEAWSARADGGSCGYPFEFGARYLVLTQNDGGHASVSLCTGTKPLEEAAAELALLGAPR